jgi:hypothetical protein
MVVHELGSLKGELAHSLQKKYRHQLDKLRWSMKPIFMMHLLEDYDTVLYFDNDIDVVGPLDLAWEKTQMHSVMLCPHFYPTNPSKDQNWLEANFRVGLFNAGFFGASKAGLASLQWWAHCCLYNIKQAYWRGLFDDQKYLDLLPIQDPGVGILHHRGHNVAAWNTFDTLIQKEDQGNFQIQGDRLTFIHFAPLSLREFSKSTHPLHEFYLDYTSRLIQLQPNFKAHQQGWSKTALNSVIYYIRWRLARLFENP